MATHEAHASACGKYRWVEGAGGLYHHAGGFDGLKLMAHPAEAAEAHVPLPLVVLRCRCDQPESHAAAGDHCPMAEVDLGETFAASMDFRVGQ